MRHLKVQHIFVLLMTVAAVSAFLFPGTTVSKRPNIEGLFAPVSRPTGAMARWAHARFFPVRTNDHRELDDVRLENERLRAELAYVQDQLRRLQVLNEDRAQLGGALRLCTPVTVVGADAAAAQSLALSSGTGIEPRMVVLHHAAGVVGRVTSAGPGGARVRLITDRDFSVEGRIIGYTADVTDKLTWQPRPISHTVVLKGIGQNQMQLTMLDAGEANSAGVQLGDAVVLADPNWPEVVQGMTLGKITSIGAGRGTPMWGDIRVEPTVQLTQLGDVMVMNKLDAQVASGG